MIVFSCNSSKQKAKPGNLIQIKPWFPINAMYPAAVIEQLDVIEYRRPCCIAALQAANENVVRFLLPGISQADGKRIKANRCLT